VPDSRRRRIEAFAAKLYERLAARGHSHAKRPDELIGVGLASAEAPLNLQSLLFHVGADLPILFESPHGVIGPSAAAFDYEAILDVHHQLFEVAAEELLSGEVADQEGN
jgi:hypothetical protein